MRDVRISPLSILSLVFIEKGDIIRHLQSNLGGIQEERPTLIKLRAPIIARLSS